MRPETILKEFEDAEAILKGHFILSSGLHSDTYMQCARVLMDARRAERLCDALAEKVRRELSETIDLVVSPAMGGVVVGYEMGRQLGISAIFCERSEGTFALRRGFRIEPGQNVLVVEDVVTTGKSSLEAMECIRAHGGNIVAEACLVHRKSADNQDVNPLPVPLISLLEITVHAYAENELPPELAALPVEKPGSRWLKSARQSA
ncbi:MAG: orotate phosphoribosyltransferase [Hyphomicrobiales bacterium]|nr:orotate phosphoribosyltransferase [Hyphomicrobiales bacterium]